MSYINPLHAPVAPTNRSAYSSLGGAVHGAPTPSRFLSPFRRRLPQAPYTPSSKWKLATGRLNQLHNTVTFDYLGYTKQGVPMRELSTRGAHALASMIQGANDAVLSHTGLTRITIRILVRPSCIYIREMRRLMFLQWPGYEHVEWARSIEIAAQGPMTRAQLGAAVAMNFARFVEVSPPYITCSSFY
jgi:hypothetical protein